MHAREIVEKATVPAIAVDERDRILHWNTAAAELFGQESACGRCFHEITGARTVSGRPAQNGQTFGEMAWQGKPPRSFELEVRSSTGELVNVEVSVVAVLTPPAHCNLVYLLARRAPRAIGVSIDGTGSEADGMSRLSRRERQVLGLLVLGMGTEAISKRLEVTIHTVRSHVRSILSKMQVHSKIEAVSIALRSGMLKDGTASRSSKKNRPSRDRQYSVG